MVQKANKGHFLLDCKLMKGKTDYLNKYLHQGRVGSELDGKPYFFPRVPFLFLTFWFGNAPILRHLPHHPQSSDQKKVKKN